MFTASESRLMYESRPGDVLFIQGDLIKVCENDGQNIAGTILDCGQFAACDLKATQLLPHPIMTYVPSCDRCAEILAK